MRPGLENDPSSLVPRRARAPGWQAAPAVEKPPRQRPPSLPTPSDRPRRRVQTHFHKPHQPRLRRGPLEGAAAALRSLAPWRHPHRETPSAGPGRARAGSSLNAGPRPTCVVRRGPSGQRPARAGEAGPAAGAQRLPAAAARAWAPGLQSLLGARLMPTLSVSRPGRPGSRSSRQGRSRPRCSCRLQPQLPVGPSGSPQWDETRTPSFAPVRTPVWPPEQGTHTLGPQFCRVCCLAPVGLGRSRT